jgi:hypothetical protein
MRYFQYFPTLTYRTTEIQNGLPQKILRTVPNMTVRLQSITELGAYEWYKIQDRDRADLLAAQWYGDSRYSWVVMLSNNMRDLYDWPMNNLEFHHYMAKKYESVPGLNDGVEQSQDTVYQYLWKNPDTGQELVIDETLYSATPLYERREISVYDYENGLNDKRRDIKRLLPDTFQSFLRQFEQLMGRLNNVNSTR